MFALSQYARSMHCCRRLPVLHAGYRRTMNRYHSGAGSLVLSGSLNDKQEEWTAIA